MYGPFCVKLLTRLRIQFSHLNKHKFKRDSGDTINTMFVEVEIEIKLKLVNTLSCVVIFFLHRN